MSRRIRNAVLLALAPGGRILVQDRRGHRPPPWGFFGGGIETGEEPLETVIREAREELGLALAPGDLQAPRVLKGQFGNLGFELHVFVWLFDGNLTELRVLEGAGAELVTPDDMLRRVRAGGPDHAVTRLAGQLIGGRAPEPKT